MAQAKSQSKAAKRPGKTSLRQRAETQTPNRTLPPGKNTPGETRRLLHELQMQQAELRRAQQELEESRKYFDLYDLAPVGFLTLSDTGIILEANLTAAGILGVEKSRLIKKPLTRFIVREDRDIFDLHRRQLVETGVRQACEIRMVRAAGDPVWVNVQAIVLRGKDDVAAYRVTLSDIAERKHAEEKLHVSEARYRRLFETAKDGILILDADTGRVDDVNPFLVEMLGYSHDALLGKKIWELGFFKDTAANQVNFRHLQEHEYIRYEDLPLETVDGRQIDVEFVSNAYVVSHKKVIQCNIRDITARKQAESAVSRANLRLAEQIAELHNLHDQLRDQTVRDPLTQLYNRRYLNETLPREIALALRQNYAIGIVMLDIDHFKDINDTYGHSAGDEALRVVAGALTARLRASDIICRYGGDEFLCLLLNTNREIALLRAEQVRAAIAELPIVAAHPTVRASVSIGVALFPPHGSDMIAILKAADAALYQAKAEGRNCVRVARAEESVE